uniref:ubiquitinyl hydrolase 1 n=1 Tax=Euplotes harpa TaxID=151035 RepID=A0A7S3JA83_9SPIT|mmetsp:Transcript_23779/g.27348  ORF Transcript_23779/g.27348 Transcript_23779/m.27348 type:complete len:253 (+) Transcript_23779:136-894(+)
MILNKQIAESMPFVSKKLNIDDYKEHWKDNKFYDSFISLLDKYSRARELRRDGNCFYRALLWQMFEYFLTTKSSEASEEYEKILGKISNSKADLLALGYDEIVIDDFYDQFLTAFKDLKDATIDVTDEEAVHEYLEKLFSNESLAPYLLMHCRFMTSAYLKANSILYEDFMVDYADVGSYCDIEIEGVDREAEQMAIIGITNYLGIAAEINQVSANGNVESLTIPEDAIDDGKRFIAKLLFTPGHYDSLYTH